MTNEHSAEHDLSKLVDHYAEHIGPREMERLLQTAAQDMREEYDAYIQEADLEGWTDG